MIAFTGLPIETPRLRLRAAREDDAPALLEVFADNEVTRYWSSQPWTEIAQARERIARDLQGLQSGADLVLMIERMEDQRLLGRCTLFRIDHSCRRAEVGYALTRQAWGQGYITEALQSLLRYGFEQLELNRVEADVDPRNTASMRVLQRLGFQQEGLLRERWIVAGEVSDSAMFGMLQREWAAARASMS